MSLRALACIGLWAAATGALSAEVRRVVILKLDGVPHDVLEREMQQVDPATGKSVLPWMDLVFRREGARLANFYVRGISLSAPSWSLLDTGQHLEIRGNAEFDRYTYHVYDYLNFFPFYFGYALSKRVDMPGVEVLDDLGIPLLIDRFPFESVYQSFQLFQRGVRWSTLQRSLQRRFSHSIRQLLDEWTIGFEIGSSIQDQTERELIADLQNPRFQYLDYFTGDYDHVAHGTPDPAAQRLALQRIDALVGRVWSAIETSPLAAQTALIAVSDHGMNTDAKVYSQGYDLVEFFNSRAGGSHHVVTDRHPLTEYKLKGLDPFVSEVVTPSESSLYLKGESKDYPTVLLDLDGNERASVYLRNSDFNVLQILLDEMSRTPIQPGVRRAAITAFFDVVGKYRTKWESTVNEMRQELAALQNRIDDRRALIEAQPKRWTTAQRAQGLDKAARRVAVQMERWKMQEREYSDYCSAISKLLTLTPADFEKRRYSAPELIPKRAMGDKNTLHDIEKYVVGPGPAGLVLAPDGSLDLDRSFRRVNYLPVLTKLSVRNNVQPEVASHPVDFVAMRLSELPKDFEADDAVFLYGGDDREALILSRRDAAGVLELRYVFLSRFETVPPGPNFPLRIFEDKDLAIPDDQRAQWLSGWHSELDWLRAVHKTRYSDGILALHEQFTREKLPPDADLLQRLNRRQRQLAEPDFIIFANDHWNFNVRGFNPGGNHGSMLRISTHSVLMLAGGADTGIPHGTVIDEPYDSLSFVPTILDLMGQTDDARKLPGRPIVEVLPPAAKPTAP